MIQSIYGHKRAVLREEVNLVISTVDKANQLINSTKKNLVCAVVDEIH